MAEPARVVRYLTEVMDDRTQDLKTVLEILREVGADYALIGGLAVGYYGRERATIDVDMLVPGRYLGWIADAARARGYVVTTPPHMVRIYTPGSDPDNEDTESIADIISVHSGPVFQAAFQGLEPVEVLGERVQIVSRGALVALKFHASESGTRELEDQHQDIADIGRIVKRRYNAEDEETARRIVALSYPGAEEDFDQLIVRLLRRR